MHEWVEPMPYKVQLKATWFDSTCGIDIFYLVTEHFFTSLLSVYESIEFAVLWLVHTEVIGDCSSVYKLWSSLCAAETGCRMHVLRFNISAAVLILLKNL